MGDTPTQPYGMAPYQWLLLDISTALGKVAEWDSFPTNWGVGGQWAPTELGRMAANDFSKYNSLPLIQYNPTLSIPGPNQYDARNGLLFSRCLPFDFFIVNALDSTIVVAHFNSSILTNDEKRFASTTRS